MLLLIERPLIYPFLKLYHETVDFAILMTRKHCRHCIGQVKPPDLMKNSYSFYIAKLYDGHEMALDD